MAEVGGDERPGDQDQQCTARTRYRVVEHPARQPMRLPARRLTAIVQCGITWENGMPKSRAGGAVMTTIRLIALSQDHRLQRGEPEQPDRQRQPELRAAQPDQAHPERR